MLWNQIFKDRNLFVGYRYGMGSVVDPNSKESEYLGWIRIRQKKLGFGFGSRHCCKIFLKNCEKSQMRHLKEKGSEAETETESEKKKKL
jgi:hypothetical protein